MQISLWEKVHEKERPGDKFSPRACIIFGTSAYVILTKKRREHKTMAKLTKEQAIKWDKMLSGGYRFDWRHYVLWGEKTASLKVELSEDKVLEASLSYREDRQGYRATGRQKPVLHLSIWNVNLETGVGTSHGLGAFIDVGEVQEKKNWKYLCELSREYTAEKVLELAREHAGQLGNPYLFTKTA